MTKITLPSTLKELEDNSVAANESLREVHCAAVVPPVCGERTFLENDEECTLYVPADSKAAYEAADYWKDFYKIEEETTAGISNDLSSETPHEVSRYNSIGQGIGKSYSGIQIIRYSNGKTVKTTR